MKARVLVLSHVLAAIPAICGAAIHEYYVGVDQRSEITSGAYAGQANPNQGRLTFLFAHADATNPASNHFHGIGAYSYTGEVPNHVVQPTNANNRIPETFTGLPPLSLHPGDGPFAGKLITKATDEEYSDLSLRLIHDLSGFGDGAPETYLYNSSGGRYQTPLTNLRLGLELASLTPGLHVGMDGMMDIVDQVGDTHEVGAFPFVPVLWTDENAGPGIYSASFRLRDLSGGFSDSGTFHFDVQVVPEPATLIMLACGAALVALTRRDFRKNPARCN